MGLYTAAVSGGGLEAQLAETNYQANMIRISRLREAARADVALVGSSVTGRILPSYFSERLRVLNLGLDGGSPVTGMQLLADLEDPPPVVFLETVVIGKRPSANDQALLNAKDDPGYLISGFLPPIRPEFRPSSVLYTGLKMWWEAHGAGQSAAEVGERTIGDGMDPEELGLLYGDAVERLRQKGCRVALLNIPAKFRIEDCWIDPGVAEFARLFKLPVLDTTVSLAENGFQVRYTDGFHLTAPSAAAVAQAIVSGITTLDWEGSEGR